MMQKQRARSREDKEYRRKKILESSRKLFSGHGYQGTTIEMITEDAKLSPAAFYLYFKSKIEAYRAINIEGTAILEAMITGALSQGGMSAEGKMRAMAEAYLRFFMTEREYYDTISVLHLGQKEFFTDLNMVPVLEKQAGRLLRVLSGIIGEGISSGEFRRVDPWQTAAALWGMIDGVLIMEVKGSTGFIGVTLKKMMACMLDIVIAGLRR